ncbi:MULTISPECIES: 8-amino-7-oxononanoate synthase [Candidatus Williamhamiltonella]|uniref:8-amino-7-oxononanoate synthase n=1 Tax=Candidatus Williamhamiltonella defendens TaxID=138072 RepID=A0A2D3TCU0_9ENTR|nr:8-amino-7-oxononanoate synthase [Candidatus Hamiltonella defensa]ATW33588.1 8-amino-7-oxononanoate synthase [Candidatus Hamiltonella defensa]AYB48375.1 8-amino-7-oxononanoate synthase [Candidatus Hamiltonella defensa]
MSWLKKIDQALQKRRYQGLYRTRFVNQTGTGRWLQINDRRYLNFSSNDYLGLSQNKEVIKAWQKGAEQYGVGSGGSGHITGYTKPHAVFEETLSDWLGYPRALLFTSGYSANQALLAALLEPGDRVLADRLSHASLLEGMLYSATRFFRFEHNQIDSLQKHLKKPCSGETLVITEGLFSMDGDSASLGLLHQHSSAAGALLLVDDAHGIGVKGVEGRGSCWQEGVKPELLVVTFGKAFGLSGAAILCSEDLAQYFLQFSRHLIYSTAMPPAQAYALSVALKCVREGNHLRQQLQANIVRFRQGMQGFRNLLSTCSDSAIQPIFFKHRPSIQEVALKLRDYGLWVPAIRPPTVPKGTERLRITITAAQEFDDIDRLLEGVHLVLL